MNGFLGEFFGTMVLIALGVGTCAGVNLKDSYARESGWLFVTIAWGMSVTFGVYVAASFGSEGHLNPVVTIPFAIIGMFPWKEVGPYILGQILGAFVGALLVIIQYGAQFKNAKNADDGNTVGIFATGPAINSGLSNFLSETIATFVFILALLNLGDFTKGLKPVIVGLLIMVIGQAFGGTTGFALNPVRDWVPRFVYTIIPIPNKGNANWGYAWVPLLGPFAGALLAVGIHHFFM